MDGVTAQLAAAAIGAMGVLVGSVSTQVLTRTNDKRRRQEEQEGRWRADRRDIVSQLVLLSIHLQRELRELAIDFNGLEAAGAQERLQKAGYHRLSDIPEDETGVELFESLSDGIAQNMISEMALRAEKAVHKAEELLADLALIASSRISHEAESLVSSLWSALNCAQRLESWKSVETAVDTIGIRRESLQDTVRADLGVR
jgi:hypothetical protein